MTPRRSVRIVRGAAVALVSMLVYAVSLGVFLALTLLVISMEEGGENLSAGSVALTKAVVLLTQGSGFVSGPITLTLTPLLATVLLIALIRALALRLKAAPSGYPAGAIVWVLVDLWLRSGLTVESVDPAWLTAAKGLLVFTIGYALAVIPSCVLVERIRDYARDHVGADLRRALRLGAFTGSALLLAYLAMGLIAVIIWTIAGRDAVGEVFAMSGMETGSRILTSVLCLAWLPNVALWAVSWLFGSGFVIGQLADFTLWIGQSSGLPAVPAFGILPRPIDAMWLRTALVLLPLVSGLVAGLWGVLSRRCFGFRLAGPGRIDAHELVLSLAYPAGAFCLSSVIVSLGATLMFSLGNGALGQLRLAHVGVDVMDSTRAVARPTALGLLMAWGLTLVGVASIFGIRWLASHIRRSPSLSPSSASDTAEASAAASDADDAGHAAGKTGDTEDSTDGGDMTPRPRIVMSQSQHKEEPDDHHKPTAETRVGVRLP